MFVLGINNSGSANQTVLYCMIDILYCSQIPQPNLFRPYQLICCVKTCFGFEDIFFWGNALHYGEVGTFAYRSNNKEVNFGFFGQFSPSTYPKIGNSMNALIFAESGALRLIGKNCTKSLKKKKNCKNIGSYFGCCRVVKYLIYQFTLIFYELYLFLR